MFHFEHRRTREGIAAGNTAETAEEDPNAGKKIVDWGEDGKPIYEDGTVGEAPAAPAATPAGGDEADSAGMWEETWGSFRDKKANGTVHLARGGVLRTVFVETHACPGVWRVNTGPTSVSTDITFHGVAHVYGIPEHATTLALKPTDPNAAGGYSEPYRLYNLDVFEYEMDEPMALYGSIPVMLGHSTQGTSGVFWHNPTETFVDVAPSGGDMNTRWISEAGIVDLMLLPGPGAKQVFFQYASLTGSQAMPPMFAIAYHQCRCVIEDGRACAVLVLKCPSCGVLCFLGVVRAVGTTRTRPMCSASTRSSRSTTSRTTSCGLTLSTPMASGTSRGTAPTSRVRSWPRCGWLLDAVAHHTRWRDTSTDPAEMQRKLAERGRKMVTIVDPHIKRDSNYHVHSEATSKGYYIKKADGSDFDGWCWPGSSSYLDFTKCVRRG